MSTVLTLTDANLVSKSSTALKSLLTGAQRIVEQTTPRVSKIPIGRIILWDRAELSLESIAIEEQMH